MTYDNGLKAFKIFIKYPDAENFKLVFVANDSLCKPGNETVKIRSHVKQNLDKFFKKRLIKAKTWSYIFKGYNTSSIISLPDGYWIKFRVMNTSSLWDFCWYSTRTWNWETVIDIGWIKLLLGRSQKLTVRVKHLM